MQYWVVPLRPSTPSARTTGAGIEAGHKIECPVLLLWGATGGVGRNSNPGPGDIWQRYAANIVAAKALPCGHYLSEEAPNETTAALHDFFAAA